MGDSWAIYPGLGTGHYSHVTPAMDHAAADLIAGLVPPAAELPLASREPRAEDQDPDREEEWQKARSDGVGRRGIEPRTRGLKEPPEEVH